MIIAEWGRLSEHDETAMILPDGCVDVIVQARPGRAPIVRVSPLMDAPTSVRLAGGDSFRGVRLRPGARVDRAALADVVAGGANELEALASALPAFARCPDPVADALACLADAPSGAAAARRAGVSPRTLQRLLRRETGQGPDFWRRLARARRAGRAAIAGDPLAEIAFREGYADQAHMTRELLRWLGAPPGRLASDAARGAQLVAAGYG